MNYPTENDGVSNYGISVTYQDGSIEKRHLNLPVIDHPTQESSQYFNITVPFGDIKNINISNENIIIYSQGNNIKSNVMEKPGAIPSTINKPKVSENNQETCLDWQPLSNSSASLLLNNQGENTVVILDDDTGHACISTANLPTQGQWQIVVRQGLVIQEYLQLR